MLPLYGGGIKQIFGSHTIGRKEKIMLGITILQLCKQLCGGVFQQRTIHIEIERQDNTLILAKRKTSLSGNV